MVTISQHLFCLNLQVLYLVNKKKKNGHHVGTLDNFMFHFLTFQNLYSVLCTIKIKPPIGCNTRKGIKNSKNNEKQNETKQKEIQIKPKKDSFRLKENVIFNINTRQPKKYNNIT